MKIKRRFAVLLLTAAALLLPCKAEPPLSPAIKVIAASHRMVKSTVREASAGFEAEDFDALLGCRVKSLTITALPEATSGSLMLGRLPVAKGQTISRDYIGRLCFLPGEVAGSQCGFSFSAATEYADYKSGCTLYILDCENTAPTSAGLDDSLFCLEARQNIELYASLAAWDEQGDGLYFEISLPPENGSISLDDPATGAFCYSPDEDFVGTDSFCYTARDSYGASSEVITVNINVTECELFYSDLCSHWAHSSAIKMSERGIMEGRVGSGMRLFEPQKRMSRAEFVTAAMKALGHELSGVVGAETAFWDNDDIPDEDVAYISEAARLGYIGGAGKAGQGICFMPNEPLSRAQAADIIHKMLGTADPLYRAVFADETEIPYTVRDSIYTLNSLGVMEGIGNNDIGAAELLTRAEAAVLLDKMMSVTR